MILRTRFNPHCELPPLALSVLAEFDSGQGRAYIAARDACRNFFVTSALFASHECNFGQAIRGLR